MCMLNVITARLKWMNCRKLPTNIAHIVTYFDRKLEYELKSYKMMWYLLFCCLVSFTFERQ
jgi:hypothetical protein